jgi:hypothetical protein
MASAGRWSEPEIDRPMTPILLLLSLQLPVPQGPVGAGAAPAPAAHDVVLLKNGDRLEGRIQHQLDGYVEIQLEAGATVGISIAQVASIQRGAVPSEPQPATALLPRNEWFLLHDGHGASVGWLHASVTIASDGAVSMQEEYEFVEGRRRYQITSLCTADARLQPLSCYFRERISEPTLGRALLPGSSGGGQGDRIADERIVEATLRGDRLQVVRLDRTGRRERAIDVEPGTTFPLLLRAVARQRPSEARQLPLFDPATEEITQGGFTAGRERRIVLDGAAMTVTELAEASANGRNHEWLDANWKTVRREIAGPSLVAVPSSAESARAMVGGVAIPSALVREAGGTFGVWAPNPAWSAVDGLAAGQVALFCQAHDASIGFTRLDHLEPGASLDTAVEAVGNWFLLLHPGLALDRREPITVRERAAVRLWAAGRSGGIMVQATVDVIPHGGRFLVLVCRAPRSAWDELASDFAFLLRTVELDAEALEPTLQGPLAKPPAQGAPAPRKGSAPAGKKASPPLVRIPKGT